MDAVAVILTPDNVERYEREIRWTNQFRKDEDYRILAVGQVLLVNENGPILLSLTTFFTVGWRFEYNTLALRDMRRVIRKS